MTEEQEILVILMEECAEVTQEASKILRFGSEDKDRIEKEIADVLTMVELLSRHDYIDVSVLEDHIQAKLDKLREWSRIRIPD